jgi:hypothetical protein
LVAALQARRSRFRFPMVSLEFFIDIILPGVDSAFNRNEYQKYFLGGKGGRCVGLKPYHLHVPIILKSGVRNLLEPPLPDHRTATHWVQHTTSCIAQSHAPDDGQNCCPKHVELILDLPINRYCCIYLVFFFAMYLWCL